ncbi:MAG: hypothetical protein ABWZ40_02540 [Caulobacterales bacterium]
MKFICSVGDKTWFQLETEHEAAQEAQMMGHAVDKYFRASYAKARESYRPGTGIERDIGLKSHIARSMPLFLTLRDGEGNGLATAMLPPGGAHDPHFHAIIVGPNNSDPYQRHGEAIAALGGHFKLSLPREFCFPYG